MSTAAPLAPRPLLPDNKIIILDLETLVKTTPFDNEKLLQLLLKLQPEDDNPKLSSQIERVFNLILMAVLAPVSEGESSQGTVGLPTAGISQLKDVLKVVFASQKNKAIKRTLVITFIENVLECLGVTDLT